MKIELIHFIRKFKTILIKNKLFLSILFIIFSYYLYNNIMHSSNEILSINCFSHYKLFLGEQQSSIFNKFSDFEPPADIYDHPDLLFATLYDSTNISYYELYFSGIFNRLDKIIIKVEFKDEYTLLNNFNCIVNSLSQNNNIKYYYDKINSNLYIQNTSFNSNFWCSIQLHNIQNSINEKNTKIYNSNKNYIISIALWQTGLFEYFKKPEINNKINKEIFFQKLENYKKNKIDILP